MQPPIDILGSAAAAGMQTCCSCSCSTLQQCLLCSEAHCHMRCACAACWPEACLQALSCSPALCEDTTAPVQASTHHIRSRWSGCLQAALAECGWPPTPANSNPDGPAPAQSAWRGFQHAPEASAAAAQAAFAALLQLQAARGMRPAAAAAAAGPWADPELWAVRELLQEQLRGLQETFMSGGVFDRPDATTWVFQVSRPALALLRSTGVRHCKLF